MASYPVQPAASVRKYSFSIVAPEPAEEARSAEGQVVEPLFQEDIAAVEPIVEEARANEGRPVLVAEVPEVVEELLEEAESKINNLIPEAREEKKIELEAPVLAVENAIEAVEEKLVEEIIEEVESTTNAVVEEVSEVVTEAIQETTTSAAEEIVTEAVQETTLGPIEIVTEAREEKALNEEVAIEEVEAFAPSVVAAPENIAVVETPAGYRYYYRY